MVRAAAKVLLSSISQQHISAWQAMLEIACGGKAPVRTQQVDLIVLGWHMLRGGLTSLISCLRQTPMALVQVSCA
jgi:hypothetical protein